MRGGIPPTVLLVPVVHRLWEEEQQLWLQITAKEVVVLDVVVVFQAAAGRRLSLIAAIVAYAMAEEPQV